MYLEVHDKAKTVPDYHGSIKILLKDKKDLED